MGQAKRRREGVAIVAAAPKSRISNDDAAYLRRVLSQSEQAGALERQAVELELQAADLRRRATALYGAHESFIEHLCEKHGLEKDRDRIDPASGTIFRGLVDPGPAVIGGASVNGSPPHGSPVDREREAV